MKTAALAGLTAAFALTGCSDLTRPSTFRVSKDPAGSADQVAVAPDNLIRVPGADGKPVALPRLHPPGTPNAGQAVMPGQKVEPSPRPAAAATTEPVAPAAARPARVPAPKGPSRPAEH